MGKSISSSWPGLWTYLAVNFAFSLLIGVSYLFFAGSPLELFFVACALISNTFMLYAVMSVFALALSPVRYGKAVFAVLQPYHSAVSCRLGQRFSVQHSPCVVEIPLRNRPECA